jgi:hypothetical protein
MRCGTTAPSPAAPPGDPPGPDIGAPGFRPDSEPIAGVVGALGAGGVGNIEPYELSGGPASAAPIWPIIAAGAPPAAGTPGPALAGLTSVGGPEADNGAAAS